MRKRFVAGAGRVLAGATVCAAAVVAPPSEASQPYDRGYSVELVTPPPSTVLEAEWPEGGDRAGAGARPMSGDGRYFVYATRKTIAGPVGSVTRVWIYDAVTRRSRLLSTTENGAPPVAVPESDATSVLCGSNPEVRPTISRNGRYVVFVSDIANLRGSPSLDPCHDVFFVDLQRPDRIELISPTLEPGHLGHAANVSVSDDGRYVAYTSHKPQVKGVSHTVQQPQVYRRDRKTGAVTLVSVNAQGKPSGTPTGHIYAAGTTMSADGRWVAFASNAADLVSPAESGSTTDIFLRDLLKRRTTRVNVNYKGVHVGSAGYYVGMSSDARYVAFVSRAGEMVPTNTQGIGLYVWDRTTGRTERVSVDSAGRGISVSGFAGSGFSRNGRFAAFYGATRTSATAGEAWVFVHDRETGETRHVARKASGVKAKYLAANWGVAVDDSGRRVAWAALDDDVTRGDGNGRRDWFVTDSGPALGDYRTSVRRSGSAVSVSTRLAFSGAAIGSRYTDRVGDAAAVGTSSLPASDTTGLRVVYRRELSDLSFQWDVKDLPTMLGDLQYVLNQAGLAVPGGTASVGGDPRVTYRLKFTANGVPYEVRARLDADVLTLLPPAKAMFGLFTCGERVGPTEASCTQQASLAGSLGEVGSQLRVSVPLSVLKSSDGKPMREGQAVSDLRAETVLMAGGLVEASLLDTLSATGQAVIPRATVTFAVKPAAGRPYESSAPAGVVTGRVPVRQRSVTWTLRTCLGARCATTSGSVR